jgi:hypothetical protein
VSSTEPATPTRAATARRMRVWRMRTSEG